ncbi:hypothetical protein SAMN05216378_1507 [Paenibacillus catalpae]|uniref:EF-hand domain-containing protein n=1 Tax=Paenibacillus catalpae TaxID=1045775 RepID=A0A1I1VJD4_9BACL|nr:hypothetical protein [Paenibacillus catalpae]SFD80600.1 hypothetical protein SAMN05216378_1507 [Paenibacillus catalpae]
MHWNDGWQVYLGTTWYEVTGTDPGTDPAPTADLDGNGQVNGKDAIEFLRTFGTKRGQLHYNPKADFDADGVIWKPDLIAFVKAGHFGAGLNAVLQKAIAEIDQCAG